jgi:hypothetical protein
VDVVYIVKPGDAKTDSRTHEELRFSLRSLANLPHDRVWLAGYTPSWVAGVGSIPVEQTGAKHGNALANLIAACEHPDVSDEFVVFNDDFFVTAPLASVPALHRGPVRDVHAALVKQYPRGSHYATAMMQTCEWLESLGVAEPLSYEMHAPMVLSKAGMLEVIERALGAGLGERFHNRTAYGNLTGVGGVRVDDCKVYTGQRVDMPTPFASTLDATFRSGWVGRRLRGMWQEPGEYEVVTSSQRGSPASVVPA